MLLVCGSSMSEQGFYWSTGRLTTRPTAEYLEMLPPWEKPICSLLKCDLCCCADSSSDPPAYHERLSEIQCLECRLCWLLYTSVPRGYSAGGVGAKGQVIWGRHALLPRSPLCLSRKAGAAVRTGTWAHVGHHGGWVEGSTGPAGWSLQPLHCL